LVGLWLASLAHPAKFVDHLLQALYIGHRVTMPPEPRFGNTSSCGQRQAVTLCADRRSRR
jgi:hypothetical protein